MFKKLIASVGVAGLLLLGSATATQADYVAPEMLVGHSGSGWMAGSNYDGEDMPPPTFTSCSIVFPGDGGFVGYDFDADEGPAGVEEIAEFIESFSANVTLGGGKLWVIIDRTSGDSLSGIADVSVAIPVGTHGFDLDSVVSVNDSPSLGLPADPTLQEFLDALEATGDEFYIINFNFNSSVASEVQWLAFGGETYWFGTDANWFPSNPTCAPDVPTVITPPAKIETAVA